MPSYKIQVILLRALCHFGFISIAANGDFYQIKDNITYISCWKGVHHPVGSEQPLDQCNISRYGHMRRMYHTILECNFRIFISEFIKTIKLSSCLSGQSCLLFVDKKNAMK